ncbi:MAG: outer membrane protein assembly factor BamD [Alphaproteobacteria bacterium]|nr:outer membrane protein assembly factor BamD [Alphaproteobacteria bacterium]
MLAAGLGACGGDRINYFEADVSTLYTKAHEFMEAEQYRFAAVTFDEVERQHPYSVWARRATLMSAYNHYLSNDYDAAILAARRFLALHPGNKNAPYAHYLIGLSYYEQIQDVGRDQKNTRFALNAMNELVRRYPNSTYAADARLKIELARDHLAGKEMEVGRFYLKQKNYIAAVNRFKTVVEEYQTTSHVAEALHRMVEVYLALGIYEEAKKSAAVLGYNYPDTDWYEYSFAMMQGRDIQPVSGDDNEGWFDWLF